MIEELPPRVSELVALLVAEVQRMDEPLRKLLQADRSLGDEFSDAWIVYDGYLERFGDAVLSIGFSGLHQTITLMREQLGLLVAEPYAFTTIHMRLLATWSGHASAYLCAPHSTAACQELIAWLQAPEWPQPLGAEQAQKLLYLLQAPDLSDSALDEKIEARPRHAAPEDISLALPDDISSELLDALLQELPGQTHAFSEAIQGLISDGSVDAARVAQRLAHTLKGAGNTIGIRGISVLTHHLEDILVALAETKTTPDRTLALSLMKAAGCLEAMSNSLCGMADDPSDAQAVLQEVLDWANRIERQGPPMADQTTPTAPMIATVAAIGSRMGPAEMVSIKTQTSRLQRSVQQTCRATEKQARLQVSGADTLIDSEVLNALVDSLVHILRNAVDHGIESPEQRLAAGKPEGGNIWLDFLREGNTILAQCRDDGAGFDFAAIRQAAVSRGLLEPGQAVSEDVLKNLLLMPNFSTCDKVTQTSGRGVGLDVVYAHALCLDGSLTLESEADKGSTIALRLPVSLIATHAPLCEHTVQ